LERARTTRAGAIRGETEISRHSTGAFALPEPSLQALRRGPVGHDPVVTGLLSLLASYVTPKSGERAPADDSIEANVDTTVTASTDDNVAPGTAATRAWCP
jgi:hypothetical protein